jgi:hypothetical protein
MPGFGIFNLKDIDGRHFRFPQQQKGMSCGPTSVRIAKQLYYNREIGEEMMRGAVGLRHLGSENTGQSLAAAAAATAVDWDVHGTMEQSVLPAVKHEPFPIFGAHFAHGIAQLGNASRNHPAILGFNWNGGGGHFVVCVGPTKTDQSLFVILDPDGGLQYLSREDAVGTTFYYKPSYGGVGQIDPIGFIAT